LAKTSTPSNDPKFYQVTLEYIPAEGLFYVKGSLPFLSKYTCVDGFTAAKILKMYTQELMHEIEVLKRQHRDEQIAKWEEEKKKNGWDQDNKEQCEVFKV
jgi:hypothetical protein